MDLFSQFMFAVDWNELHVSDKCWLTVAYIIPLLTTIFALITIY